MIKKKYQKFLKVEHHSTWNSGKEFINITTNDLITFDNNLVNQKIVESVFLDLQRRNRTSILRLENIKYLIKEHIYALKIQSIIPELKYHHPITLMRSVYGISPVVVFIKGTHIFFSKEYSGSVRTGNHSTDKNIFIRTSFELGKNHPLRKFKNRKRLLYLEYLFKGVIANPFILENSNLQQKIIDARRLNIPMREFLDKEVSYKKIGELENISETYFKITAGGES